MLSKNDRIRHLLAFRIEKHHLENNNYKNNLKNNLENNLENKTID